MSGQSILGVGSASNAFFIGSNAFVGIGKSNAAHPLDVAGSINFSGLLLQNGAPFAGSQFTTIGSNVALLGGSNLAIGKSNASYALDVVGDVNFSGALRNNGSLFAGSQFLTSGSNVALLGGSNLAIGKSNANYTLDVVGDVNFSGALRNNGSLFAGSQFTTVSGSNVALLGGSNMAIGKSNASYALDVVGDINITGAFRVGGSNLGNMVGNVKQVAVKKLFVGSTAQHTLAIDNNNGLHSWGYNDYGQLGTTTNNGTLNANPTPVSILTMGSLNGKTITAVSCGNIFTLALDSNGGLHSWGRNRYGELGTSTNSGTDTANPTPVSILTMGSLNGKTITAVSCGYTHILALDSNGGLHSWGQNYFGQLGTSTNNGIFNANPTPVSILTMGSLSGKTISAIACGESHTLALDNNGGLHSWGMNGYGQLGINTNNGTANANPVPVSILTQGSLSGKTITAVSCGYTHTLALDSNGGLHSWGGNGYGQLGNSGTSTANPTPVSILTMGSLSGKTITAVSCGASHTLALDSTGGLHSWGRNAYGQLGTTTNSGTETANPTPVSILTMGSLSGKTISAVSCGAFHTLALDNNGGIHSWGYNRYGTLGNSGTETVNPIPVYISSFGSLGTLKNSFYTMNNLFTNFTGQHRCFLTGPTPNNQATYQGLIACASESKYTNVKISGDNKRIEAITSGNAAININESLPVVSLSSISQDKRAFGVISMSKDNANDSEINAINNLRVSLGDTRVEINSVGEGAMWVCDAYGALESGDFVTTCIVPGYGQKQADDLLHNYTVAKVTMDVDFDAPMQPVMRVKTDASGKHVLDDQGEFIWEPVMRDPVMRDPVAHEFMRVDSSNPEPWTLPASSPIEDWVPVLEPVYQMRYLTADGTHITKEEYTAAKNADVDAMVYRAAFIGCTYHC
jgi:alpha-tubulin suppressor-like RCC1 family protein